MNATTGFIVPPENAGQGVEVAYASTTDGVYAHVIRRRIDRSDLSVGYAIAKCLADDQGDYWNAAPRNKRWRPITAAAAAMWLEGKYVRKAYWLDRDGNPKEER